MHINNHWSKSRITIQIFGGGLYVLRRDSLKMSERLLCSAIPNTQGCLFEAYNRMNSK